MPVRILPDAVINRIRAGEVVERPAQLVKELAENALDAGARTVRITLAGGGRELACVEDDGCGMDRGDLDLAVERQATSKLDSGDLSAVSTLGFRGEALTAIGAVCRLSVQSRTADAECGWSIAVENGAKGSLSPCAQRPGTRVEARGLFAAHPARASFLRRPRQEAAAAREAVEALAISRPDVAFFLECDGRQALALPAADWEARVRAVMGAAFAENSVPFSAKAGGAAVRGRIGLPSWSGHVACGQRILANGRPVRDRTVAGALKAAFADVSRDTVPAAAVAITVDSASIDVNVHPAKAEVRWRDPAGIAALVRSAIAEALGASGPLSSAALSAQAAAAARPLSLGAEGDPEAQPLGRGLGMALGTFILSARHDGVVIVDAHAAHERLVHSRLKRAALDGGVAPRRLAAPLCVQVGEAAAALFEEHSAALASLGLAVQAADGGTVVVTAVPEPLRGTDAASLVLDVAAALSEDPHSDPLRQGLERICGLLACHAAVRSGSHLDPEAADRLLREMEASPDVASVCIHGRPTAAFLDRAALESLFRRR